MSRTVRVALVLAVSLVAGCRASRAGTSSSPAAAPSDSDVAAIIKARADSARYPYTPADVSFMSRMIGHHSQAIVMSRLAPSNGASPSVRTLAERIINAQEDEIALMQHWLRDRGQPVPSPGAMAEHAHHGDSASMMPGMLTPAQMTQLAAATGTEFDRLFLTNMIQHHRGAVAMVNELFATPGAAQDQSVFKLASDVNVDQTTEIARMASMLTAILFQRPP